ncbi:hypothetical protein [Tolypothrix sp. VBCCA 56010]
MDSGNLKRGKGQRGNTQCPMPNAQCPLSTNKFKENQKCAMALIE